MNPADDYVADFVAGISRLKVVRAHAGMQCQAPWHSHNGTDSSPRLTETPLDT